MGASRILGELVNSASINVDGSINFGTPIYVPTLAQFDNTSRVATSAFVNSVGSRFSGNYSLTSLSSPLTSAHAGALVTFNGISTNGSYTLVSPGTFGIYSNITLVNGSLGTITVLAGSGNSLNVGSAALPKVVLYPGSSLTLTAASGTSWQACGGSASSDSLRSCFRAAVQYTGSPQSFTANIFTQVNYNYVNFDVLGEYNSTTSTFTATYSGIYLFSAGLHGNGATNNNNRMMSVFINGTTEYRIDQYSNGSNVTVNNGIGGDTGPIQLNPGDLVTVKYMSGAVADSIYNQSGTNQALLNGITHFSGWRIM